MNLMLISVFFCFVIVIGSLFLPMTWENGIIEAGLFCFMFVISVESLLVKAVRERK